MQRSLSYFFSRFVPSSEQASGRPTAICPVVEALESRQLLSADLNITPTPTDYTTVPVEYHGQTVDAIPGEWIVGLKRPDPTRNDGGEIISFNTKSTFSNRAAPALQAALGTVGAALGISFGEYLGLEQSFLINTPKTVSAKQLEATLSLLPGFQSVEPNGVGFATATTPNDPEYQDKQYALNNTGQTGGTPDADIDAPEAWDYTRGFGSNVVAVLDSGVNYNHEDLVGNRFINPMDPTGGSGKNFVYDKNGVYDANNYRDELGHGTEVAGVIAAEGNNGKGITGVAWSSKILPVKIADYLGRAPYSATVAGINYVSNLRDAGVDVNIINLSYSFSQPGSEMQAAIQNAAAHDILFVTSSGNNGLNDGRQPMGWNNDIAGQGIWPSSFNNSNIISVAATAQNDKLTGFSNFGATTVDLTAPGDAIYMTSFDPSHPSNNSYYKYDSGTSFAAPMVAGVASLLFSLNPDATLADVKNAILNNVDTKSLLSGKVATGGRLNAFKAVKAFYDQTTFSKTLIGDNEGVTKADDFFVRPIAGNTGTVEVLRYITGSGYTQVATLPNSSSRKIGFYELGGNDALTVAAGVNNPIYASGGNDSDTLNAGSATSAVTLAGAAGNDTITGGLGNDYLEGSSGNDSLSGGNGNDTLNGVDGDDTIYGDAGNDLIYGGNGNDYLVGRDGRDTFYGGLGNDRIRAVDNALDYISGGGGTDDIQKDVIDQIIT